MKKLNKECRNMYPGIVIVATRDANVWLETADKEAIREIAGTIKPFFKHYAAIGIHPFIKHIDRMHGDVRDYVQLIEDKNEADEKDLRVAVYFATVSERASIALLPPSWKCDKCGWEGVAPKVHYDIVYGDTVVVHDWFCPKCPSSDLTFVDNKRTKAEWWSGWEKAVTDNM